MATSRHAAWIVALVAVTAAGRPAPLRAADQWLAGRVLKLEDPVPTTPSRRRVVVRVKDRSGRPLVGDPTAPGDAGGAMLGVVAIGGTSTFQTIALPQGTPRRGRPFWSPTRGTGWRYVDPDGEQGPVRALRITRSPGGTLAMLATLDGRLGAIDVVPPAPGVEATVALTLGTGDRYCVHHGPGATVGRNDAQRWVSRDAAAGPCVLRGEFDALTYNVAGLPEGISGSNPSVNMPLISPRLNAYDLVLVQESWQTPDPNPFAPLRVYHELLVAEALHPYQSIPGTHPFNTNPLRPAALLADGLNRMARFPFEPVDRHFWTNCFDSAADCLALKGFSVARTTLAPGVTVDVYNLHMEAGGQPQDDVLRDANVTQVREHMQTYSAGQAVIVGGDFNLHTLTEPDATQYARLLSEAGLTDACAATSCPDPGRIDKFAFRSSAGVTIEALSWENLDALFRRSDDEPLSDHDPVKVRFRWTAPGA